MQVFNGTIWTNVAGGPALPQWPPSAGDLYLGGIVAYVFIPGDPGYVAGEYHGLITTPADLSTGSEWGCWGSNLPGAGGTVLGTGNQNTIDIVATCLTAGIAAKICSDLTLNGYSDWFLPSRVELQKLHLNQVAIGGFASAVYWSSSEGTNLLAWTVEFPTGTSITLNKNASLRVRAIRYF